MGDNTNGMPTFMGRGAGVDGNGVISNIAFYPKFRTKTADYTVLVEESGSIFVTTGATAAVNFTLPAISDGPWTFKFINGADVNMTVTAETADTLVVDNDLAADSIGFETATELIGGCIEVFCDGTSVFAIPHLQTEDATLTIATA